MSNHEELSKAVLQRQAHHVTRTGAMGDTKSWVVAHQLIGSGGRKSAHERLRGKQQYRGEIVETVHNKLTIDTIRKADDRWAVVIWLRKTL